MHLAHFANPEFGYHFSPITKGVLGEVSKVKEEAAELADALEQRASIMALCELADLLGALHAIFAKKQDFSGWLEACHKAILEQPNTQCPAQELIALAKALPEGESLSVTQTAHLIRLALDFAAQFNMGMWDLLKMASLTENAFLTGRRK